MINLIRKFIGKNSNNLGNHSQEKDEATLHEIGTNTVILNKRIERLKLKIKDSEFETVESLKDEM